MSEWLKCLKMLFRSKIAWNIQWNYFFFVINDSNVLNDKIIVSVKNCNITRFSFKMYIITFRSVSSCVVKTLRIILPLLKPYTEQLGQGVATNVNAL